MLDYKKYGFKKVILGYLLVIIATLIVSLASVITFTFTLAPRFKGMISVIIFLIIPIIYLLIYIWVSIIIKKRYEKVNKKNQFKIDLLKQIMLYIIITLFLFFIFLIILRFPIEKKGFNNIPLNITIQPYLSNDSINTYNQSLLYQTNNIYFKYNITININPPFNLNLKINKSDKELIFGQNCTIINYLYNLTNYKDNKTIKLILIDYNSSINGMASVCDKENLIIMSSNSPMPNWVLAHELGHVLSAEKKCWIYNLMKEYSRECYGANWITHNFIRELQPNFLNQKQIDMIVNSIKNKFE